MSTTKTTNIIDTMDEWFKKFPALPTNIREVIVNITPWLSLIFGILGIIVGISGLGVLTVLSPLAVFGGMSGVSSYGTGFIGALIYLIGSIALLAAYPGTKAKKYAGWQFLFWSEAINLVGGLIGMHSIVSTLIGALIGFYLLFQIKSYYK